METTADRIRSVVKNILPERPHHLSLYSDRKYRVPPNYWHHQSPLQYSTFISDADRGVLLTRPYFDICEEPEPSPAAYQATPRPLPKKLNKMSFKDYQKAKKASTSPTENGVPGRLEDKKYPGAAIKLEKDTLRKEQDRTRETVSHRDSKAHEPRINGELDRYAQPPEGCRRAEMSPLTELCSRHKSLLPPKPLSRDAPTSSESKKRPMESEEGARPLKKVRPSESSASEALRKATRPETPHSRDYNSTNDKTRDGRPAQSTPGNRAKERDRAASPKIITVNGNKAHALPRKPDSSTKQMVPPLLSPLHPAIDDELETISPKKKPSERDHGGKSLSKSTKSEATTKKQRQSSQGLPPLLSPTLPPIVEEELLRVERLWPKGESSQAPSQSSETANSTRKARPKENVEDEGKRKRIVTFKIRKHLRQRIRSLLALPSKSKKERSLSVEDTPPPPKKRPRQPEVIVEAATSTATKRPKTSEAYASKAPYTPPNPPVSASLAVSGSSQLQTPGGRVSQTPGAGEGPPSSRGGPGKELLNGRFATMCRLGKKLKHDRDKEKHKQTNGNIVNSGQPERSTGDELRPAMLTMEMILAYMIAFRSQNQAEELGGNRVDEKNWATLDAHFGELRGMTRRSPPLHTLAVQLHGIMINELLRVYSIQGTVSNEPKPEENNNRKVMRVLKNSFGIWAEADKYRSKLTDERLKTPAMGPWTSAYKAAADALTIMGRLADREHINWRAEVVSPKDA